MSLNTTRTRLTALTRQLAIRWNETREHWQDAKALEFEKRYMEELLSRTNTAAAGIEELEQVLAKLRRDCE